MITREKYAPGVTVKYSQGLKKFKIKTKETGETVNAVGMANSLSFYLPSIGKGCLAYLCMNLIDLTILMI